jgi:hypothetical protein
MDFLAIAIQAIATFQPTYNPFSRDHAAISYSTWIHLSICSFFSTHHLSGLTHIVGFTAGDALFFIGLHAAKLLLACELHRRSILRKK